MLWLWTLATCLTWPVLTSFAEHAVTTGEGTAQDTLYEIAFISLQLGAWLSLSLLEANTSLFSRTDRGLRLAGEFTGMLIPCLTFALGGLAGPLAWGLHGHHLHDPGFALRLCLGGLHLAAIGVVLLHLPLGPWSRRVLLPLVTWALPALAGPDAALGPWIQRVFGPGTELLSDGFLSPPQVAYDSALWAQLATLTGWILLAWATVPGRAPAYALRDPR